ncbi:hypothetical protein [Paraburkholderia tropica]|uniref:hypothetical protein n=1 Tax=Paraburkholderia tropica TaxID=92647 RepID=UPI002AB73134|nr:hypothetical protein [Paraburkholderia tropica]
MEVRYIRSRDIEVKKLRKALMRFLRKGLTVDAERWFGPGGHTRVEAREDGWAIATPDGWWPVEPGDWILTDETGNARALSDSQFTALYAAA